MEGWDNAGVNYWELYAAARQPRNNLLPVPANLIKNSPQSGYFFFSLSVYPSFYFPPSLLLCGGFDT